MRNFEWTWSARASYLVVGAGIGAAIALLLAPGAGEQLRARIARTARELPGAPETGEGDAVATTEAAAEAPMAAAARAGE